MSRGKAAGAGEAARENTSGKQVFYLVDEEQSANLEDFRLAMRGLSAIACDEMDKGEVLVPRQELAALIGQLEKRLGNILGDYTFRSTWLDRNTRRPTSASPAPAMEPAK